VDERGNFFTKTASTVVKRVRTEQRTLSEQLPIILEMTMQTSIRNFAFRSLAVASLGLMAMNAANAEVVIIRRPHVIVRPVIAVPVVAAPVVAAPVVAAPVVAAPVAVTPVAPVVVAPVVTAPVVVPVYVPTCRFVTVPVMNALTGLTYMVTRRVCN
jgi:hypothetical protein